MSYDDPKVRVRCLRNRQSDLVLTNGLLQNKKLGLGNFVDLSMLDLSQVL